MSREWRAGKLPDGRLWYYVTAPCKNCKADGTLELTFRDEHDMCIGYAFYCGECDIEWDEVEPTPMPALLPRRES